jgi:restriction system protein
VIEYDAKAAIQPYKAVMAVPDYQKLMEPLLRIAGDGKEHSFGETVESVAKHFKLSEDERKELLPSGTQAKFENRLAWAITYVSKAGLLERTGRGRFRITERGNKVLISDPAEISTKFLRQFQEFTESRKLPGLRLGRTKKPLMRT